MRHVSLCTGYGGLDRAVQQVTGGELVAVADIDKGSQVLLAERFPDVPNLGDIKTFDWASLGQVDVLTAGYPCQPFSHAGKRKGTDDPRHLWPAVYAAVRQLRPGLVVLENVAGHLGLGFDRVLADLAALGFDAEWTLVRASDVGACHGRARLFIVARPTADAHGAPRGTWHVEPHGGLPPAARRASAQLGGRGGAPADPGRERHGRGQDARGVGRVDGEDEGGAPQRERARTVAGDRSATAPADATGPRLEGRGSVPGCEGERSDGSERVVAPADADRGRLRLGPELDGQPTEGAPDGHPQGGHSDGRGDAAWGKYAAAIARHAAVLGRPATAPTDERGRLSPRFVEWMMMLPDGWVTDVDLPRTAHLKLLGNGVVPPQAAAALTVLLARLEDARAAA